MRFEKEERLEVAARAYADPVFFCRFFLPHIFSREMPWVHRGILAILTRQTDFLSLYGDVEKIISNFVEVERDGTVGRRIFVEDEGKLHLSLGKYTELMLPRGFAKTSIAGVAIPLRNVLYRDVDFTLYVSETGKHARMQLDNVKRELAGNERIVEVFGDLRPSLADDERWAADFFETRTGMAAAARGSGEQVRGLMHRGRRPRQIIVDDFQDKEAVRSATQRESDREWFYGDVMPALPELESDSTITFLATLLGDDAVSETLSHDPQWTTVRFGAYDREDELLWPENLDEAKLAIKKQSYANAGLLHIFYMEFFNKITAPELQVFKPEFFSDIIAPAPGEFVAVSIYMDPAFSKKTTADRTAITVAAITKAGHIWVLDQWVKRGASEREKLDRFFAMKVLWNTQRQGLESIAAQAAMAEVMREEMFRKGIYFELQEIKSYRERKQDRIKAVLAPRFAARVVRFIRRFPELEAEAYDFRMDRKEQADDCLDSLVGAIVLLDDFAAAAAGDKDLAEDIYLPLEQELGGDWRWAS